MTWSLNAYGHAVDADAEADMIEYLTVAFADPAAGVTAATLHTEHHGAVLLHELPRTRTDITEG